MIVSLQKYVCLKSATETLKKCEISWKLTIKMPKRRHWHRTGVFISDSEHILHFLLVYLLLIFNK